MTALRVGERDRLLLGEVARRYWILKAEGAAVMCMSRSESVRGSYATPLLERP